MKHTHMKWAWVIIVSFFILGFIDIRFGILGIVCMTAPLFHALRGKGKLHCIKYCPRGSFLGTILKPLSLHNQTPKLFKSTLFKRILLLTMLSMLTFGIIHAQGNFIKLAATLYRFMGISFIVGIIIGIIYKPRSWCAICPMGYATQVIQEITPLNLNTNKM